MSGVRRWRNKQERQEIAKAEKEQQRKKKRKVLCVDCKTRSKLVTGAVIYPHRPELHHKNYWQCPDCLAHVGCHTPNKNFGFDGTEPLGFPANLTLRKVRCMTHRVFDPVWREGKNTRTDAYLWLADHLEIHPDKCHIGMLSLEQCLQTMNLVEEHYGCAVTDERESDKRAA